MKISATASRLPLPAEDALARLGERLSILRRIRHLTQAQMAARTGVSLSTMAAIEAGSPTVQMGFYLAALFALDTLPSLDHVAALANDPLYDDQIHRALPQRIRQ